MSILLSIPIFVIATILQAGIFSRTPLLNGSVDLILLVMVAWGLQERVSSAYTWALSGSLIASITTALPFGTLIVGYLLATSFCLYLKRIFWKVPPLAMMLATLFGTLIIHFSSLIALLVKGIFLPIDQVLNSVLLPSLLLNLISALPVYVLTSDLAAWMYPKEI